MSLDFPAAGQALWDIFDVTGIRPEFLLPVLYNESGFRPDVQNFQGAPYYGIGQNGVGDIQGFAGVDPATYLTMSASQQLSTVVKGYFKRITDKYGPLNSGARVYLAEYLPGYLPTATSFDHVIASAPSAYYEDNKTFDHGNKGYITLGDLNTTVANQAAKQAVQDAVAQTYALRPHEKPQDPTRDPDAPPSTPSFIKDVSVILLVAATGATLYYTRDAWLPVVTKTFARMDKIERRAGRLFKTGVDRAEEVADVAFGSVRNNWT